MKKHKPVLSSQHLQRLQLADQRRKVDFDTYDVTVEELTRRVETRRIDIAPVYQRQFRWDTARQSCLIESILLGIPVPPLFMATNVIPNRATQWEVVDGLQRLLTLVNFAASDDVRKSLGLLESSLALEKLEKLTRINAHRFGDLPSDIRSTLTDRPLKVVVLNDKSDLQVRFDLFERLNTGGIALSDHEVRECVFRGEFMDMLGELAEERDFKTVVRLPAQNWKDGTPQDFALRFFAFLEGYQKFEHSVKDFLNGFVKDAAAAPDTKKRIGIFRTTFRFLAKAFPNGIKSRKGTTAVNLYEGVSVGAALALQSEPDLEPPNQVEWLRSDELRQLSTGATNSRARVAGRIDYCRDQFLGIKRNV